MTVQRISLVCWIVFVVMTVAFLPLFARIDAIHAIRAPLRVPLAGHRGGQPLVERPSPETEPPIPRCIPNWYATKVATEQIAIRISADLLAGVDDLVARGVYESRAAAFRAGIVVLMDLERRRQTDRAVIDGYRRTPPTESEHVAAVASLRDAILEEPW